MPRAFIIMHVNLLELALFNELSAALKGIFEFLTWMFSIEELVPFDFIENYLFKQDSKRLAQLIHTSCVMCGAKLLQQLSIRF